MLARLVAVAVCLMWAAAEFQCPGAGRFSTTPGLCTSEYYTCNRDINKEFTAYVLSCPGKTLFNERSRKCSIPTTFSCVVPSTTNPSGQNSSTSKEMTSRQHQLQTRQIPVWFSQITQTNNRKTTSRQQMIFRKPGRPPWGTTKSNCKRTTLRTAASPQKNQLRIKSSTVRRIATTKKKLQVIPTKSVYQEHFPTKKTNIRLSYQAVRRYPPKTLTNKIFNYLRRTTPVTTVLDTFPNTAISLPTLSPDKLIKNVTSTLPLNILPTYPTLSTLLLTMTPSITVENSTTTQLATKTKKQTQPMSVHSTEKYPTVSADASPHKTGDRNAQITLGFVTQPMAPPTPMQSSSFDVSFDTTPEAILKIDNKPIIFMDALEEDEQMPGMEIVYVSNEGLNESTNNKVNKNKFPINQIRYLYDRDKKFNSNQTLALAKMNTKQSHFHKRSHKKNLAKESGTSPRLHQRQPKMNNSKKTRNCK